MTPERHSAEHMAVREPSTMPHAFLGAFQWTHVYLEGLCRGYPHLRWVPDEGAGAPSRECFAICGACPVRSDCLEMALADHLDYGYYGGTTARQRIRMRSTRWRLAHPDVAANIGSHVAGENARQRPITHGTDAGYHTHRRRGEDPCQACRTAHAHRNRRNAKPVGERRGPRK